MKKINFLSALMAAAAVLASCNTAEIDNGQPSVSAGDVISFNLSKTVETKTEYSEEDDWQINWLSGGQDKVLIVCDEAQPEVTAAEYSVTRDENQKNAGNLEATGDELCWGGDVVEHNFYAVYPSNSDLVRVQDGVATFTRIQNQVCKVTKDADGNYVGEPDMTYAYMAASTLGVKPSDDAVTLTFKPVMTTLKIVITGKDNDSQGATPITGISVSAKTKAYDNGSFRYDIAQNKIIEGSTASTYQTFVNINNLSAPASSEEDGDNSKHVDLEPNKTLTLTIFLPPVDIDAANPVTVRLHSQNSENLQVTMGKSSSTAVKASTKRIVRLPKINNQETNGNNWITPLDDDIFVSQLSIPGTHDAATGDGTTFSIGKTQELTLDQQFEMGIRAFDLRPAVNGKQEMILCHGIIATKFKWDDVMERFKSYLNANPGEFIIVFIRHEDEYIGLNWFTDENEDERWMPRMQAKLEKMKADGYTVDFRPDLTVGDMRGKILFLCRDWTKYNNDGPVVGGYTGWSHGRDGAEVRIYGPDGSEGVLNHQDCYSQSEASLSSGEKYPDVKWAVIEKYLDKSATFHTDPAMVNRWSLNHTSGYTGSSSTTNRYRENARNNNLKFYNKIMSPSWEGSTGIILSDFVGARTSGGYTVYGDLLPQAIIDNNYKYHLKRKGE